MSRSTLAIVGGGWAGIAAAVTAHRLGAQVTLFEMAPLLGGRARRADVDGQTLDNGQHILIGAYRDTLDLMREVGVDPDTVLARHPLTLVDARGQGLRLRAGPPALAFALAVARRPDWSWAQRGRLLLSAAGWAARGFACPKDWTVARLCQGLPQVVMQDLIEPLCVAALNTAAADASALVFLRVLRDGLFGGNGAADLLLPRDGLDQLLPAPALQWLKAQGVSVHLRTRVQVLAPTAAGWLVDGTAYDAVVLACPAGEAARLTRALAPDWSACAASLRHEPIVTVYLRGPSHALPFPMLALRGVPAQFLFDLPALGVADGLFAAVISGAAQWVDAGPDATARAVLDQLESELPSADPASPWRVVKVISERRATLACTPALRRPDLRVAPSLVAAGDFVDGPYPSTLEGAVRSGRLAVQTLLN